MTLPDFYLIGAAKAGTTTVYSWLSQHSRIFMSALKEPHYLQYRGERKVDAGIVRVRTLEDYEGLFASARPAQICGEASALTFYFREAAERIRELTPDAKVILLLRQPADRAWSHYQYRSAGGRECAPTFMDAARMERARREAGDDIGYAYLELSRYTRYLRTWYELIPKENFRVWLFDDLRDRPEWLAREIFRFLEVDPNQPVDFSERKNVTTVPDNEWLHQTMSSRGLWRRVAKRIVPGSLKSMLYDLHDRNRRRADEIPPELRKRLTRLYEKDMRRLEKMIGRDLSAWRAEPS